MSADVFGVKSSWLIRDGLDRERMVDMDRRLQPVRRRAFALLGLGLLLCTPWVGPWTLIPFSVAAALYAVLDKAALPADCPEFSIFSAWLASEILIAVCVALAGAEHLNALSWLAIPMVTLVGRFSDRAINVGKWLAVGLVLAVGLAVAPHEILSNPPVLLVPIALIVTVTMFLTQLMHSDLEYRDKAKQALIDPLTKLLSRAALENRLEELSSSPRSMAARWPSWSPTRTGSRRSTAPTGTQEGMPFCASWLAASGAGRAPTTRSTDSEETSSSSCCPG